MYDEIVICERKFYILELLDIESSWVIAHSISPIILPACEYALFRFEGKNHGMKKYVQRFFLLFESPDVFAMISSHSLDRKFYFRFRSNNSSLEREIGLFAENNGISRALLCAISPSLKEWYLERKDIFKTEFKNLLTYGRHGWK